MRTESWIAGAAAAVSLVQVVAFAAAYLLWRQEQRLRRYLHLFLSVAIGVLLGTVFLHLVPEAVEQLGNRKALWGVAGATMLVLFSGEQLVQLLGKTGTSHSEEGGHHRAGPHGLLAASLLHSFVDGAAVATAFAGSVRVGWLTAFAVALHEVPHRAGDFSVFVHMQVPVGRALRWAGLIGLPALVGVLTVALVGLSDADRVSWLLPVSAGSFLYIAMVNLLPELPRAATPGRVASQIGGIGLGVAIVVISNRISVF